MAASSGTQSMQMPKRQEVGHVEAGDQAPDEVDLLDEQARSGLEPPDEQPGHDDRGGRRAGRAEGDHRQNPTSIV